MGLWTGNIAQDPLRPGVGRNQSTVENDTPKSRLLLGLGRGILGSPRFATHFTRLVPQRFTNFVPEGLRVDHEQISLHFYSRDTE